jgi:hypothetical protein
LPKASLWEKFKVVQQNIKLRISECKFTTLRENTQEENEIKKEEKPLSFLFLWCHLELNQGHTDFQSVALPTELWHPFILVLQK